MTEEKRQVIRDYALALEGHGQKKKGPIKHGAAYTIVRYQVYDAKGRCDLCDCEHKAGKQALIRDEQTKTLYQAGTHCLKECLGYSEADLERAVKGRRSVAARVSRITRKTFENEQEMIEALIGALMALDRHHAEVRKCLANLTAMKDKVPLSEANEQRISAILDFYGLLSEALNFPERYQDRLQALALDPCHTKNPPLNWEVYRDIPGLTVSRVERLKDAMTKAKSRRDPIKLPDDHFLPWDYENEWAYLEAARSYYTNLADQGVVRPETLQASYDFETFNYELVMGEKMHHPRKLEDFIGIVPVPGITPVLTSSRLGTHGWQSDQTLRELEKRHGLHHRSLSQAHYHSAVQHTGNVRTDAPEDRVKDGGGTRRIQAEAVGSTQYQCSAFWPIAPWKPLYDLWYKYRAQGGREYLMSFPEATV